MIVIKNSYKEVGLVTVGMKILLDGTQREKTDEQFSFFIEHTKKNYFLREEPLLAREEIVLIALGIKKSQGFFEKDSITKIKRTFGTSDEVLNFSLRDILFRLSYAEESLTDSLAPFTTALAEFLNPIYHQPAYVGAGKDLHLHITQIIKPTLKSDPKFKYDWETASAKYVAVSSYKITGPDSLRNAVRIAKLGEKIDRELRVHSGGSNNASAGMLQSQDILKVNTKVGILLFCRETGFLKLGRSEANENLNPQSRDAKVLAKLMTGRNYQATYSDLLENNVSKTSKRGLGFVIRNLKRSLSILPKKGAKNKDCIENVRGHGYKLLT